MRRCERRGPRPAAQQRRQHLRGRACRRPRLVLVVLVLLLVLARLLLQGLRGPAAAAAAATIAVAVRAQRRRPYGCLIGGLRGEMRCGRPSTDPIAARTCTRTIAPRSILQGILIVYIYVVAKWQGAKNVTGRRTPGMAIRFPKAGITQFLGALNCICLFPSSLLPPRSPDRSPDNITDTTNAVTQKPQHSCHTQDSKLSLSSFCVFAAAPPFPEETAALATFFVALGAKTGSPTGPAVGSNA